MNHEYTKQELDTEDIFTCGKCEKVERFSTTPYSGNYTLLDAFYEGCLSPKKIAE